MMRMVFMAIVCLIHGVILGGGNATKFIENGSPDSETEVNQNQQQYQISPMQQPSQNQNPITQNLNFNIQVNTQQTSETNQSSRIQNQNLTQNKNISSATSQAISSAQSRLLNYLEQHNIHPQKHWDNSRDWIYKHPKQTIGVCVGVSYLFLCGYLFRSYQWLAKEDRWCNWKKHLTLTELQEATHQELQQQLREAILHRYLHDKTKDRLSAYMLFMNAVDAENKKISRFLKVSRWLKKLFLKKLFPINDIKIEQAVDWQSRLAFVKHIFISWAAQQNFE